MLNPDVRATLLNQLVTGSPASDLIPDTSEKSVFEWAYPGPATNNFLERARTIGLDFPLPFGKKLLWDDYVAVNNFLLKISPEQRAKLGFAAVMRPKGHILQFLYDLHTCDLVIHLLDIARIKLSASEEYLDFGCNTGRFVVTLRDCLQSVNLSGCDPQPNAISWAAANNPNIKFYLSPTAPKLPVGDNAYNGVFAFSIWSHFSAEAARKWLMEMNRIIKPGGFLMLSTHGPMSVIRYLYSPKQPALEDWLRQKDESHNGEHTPKLVRQLISEGFYFSTEYIDETASTDWGQTFMSSHWICGECSKLGFTNIGRLVQAWGYRQDIYLFQKT